MKCPVNDSEKGSTCRSTECMYNSNGACKFVMVQGMYENKDDKMVSDYFGVSVTEVKSRTRLIKAGLATAQFFEFITSKNIMDAKEIDFRLVRESEDEFDAWNKTPITWDEVLFALSIIHDSL